MLHSIHLFDDLQIVQQLRPITDHRSLGDLLIGTSSIREKWQKLGPSINPNPTSNLHLIGSLLPNKIITEALKNLQLNESLYCNEICIAHFDNSLEKKKIQIQNIEFIQYPEDILHYQKSIISREIQPNQFDLQQVKELGNVVITPENCFIHASAQIKGSILDASEGPIYIGANTEIQIGTLIQGPAVILENSITNLGAKIRPFTSIGKNCKVGGEISYSIIHEHTNKAHEGYLGNSIIGSFCNFGALSNSSNVRNDLKPVQLYDYTKNEYRQTECKSIGLVTGDYITTGIGSQFNTATVIGSHSNITCHEFPNKHIPSFTWGVSRKFEKFKFEKAISNAEAWTKGKNQHLSNETINRMKEIWKEL